MLSDSGSLYTRSHLPCLAPAGQRHRPADSMGDPSPVRSVAREILCPAHCFPKLGSSSFWALSQPPIARPLIGRAVRRSRRHPAGRTSCPHTVVPASRGHGRETLLEAAFPDRRIALTRSFPASEYRLIVWHRSCSRDLPNHRRGWPRALGAGLRSSGQPGARTPGQCDGGDLRGRRLLGQGRRLT